jgi:hypothetical protein
MRVNIGPYEDDRVIDVDIDSYDTWNMDHTLAYIILPMLKQLKETKHGAPFVEIEDRPSHLQCLIEKESHDVDPYHFEAWEWAMDEMIWSFEQKTRDWELDYYKYENEPNGALGVKLVWSDNEGRIKHQERMTNGFKLFGKYYESLWD